MDSLIKKHGAALGRVLIGLLFFFSGVGMVMNGIEGTAGMIAMKGLPLAGVLAWVVVGVKIAAGGAMIAGYELKKASLTLIGFTALTIVFYHANLDDINLFKNLAIIGGLMYVYIHSPGESWKIGRHTL